ncbi:MAG: SAM-dependent methyltransferase [Proteobacteria bacterium]|nr:SAM-dependent methyltransferase [Pseudomonadota bacterium]
MIHIRDFSYSKIPPPPQKLPWDSWPQTPLVVDIGCGVGESTISLARDNPNWTVLGIERTELRFEKFKNLQSKTQLNNLYPIRADAIAWISHNLPPKSVDHFYFYYPNPYPKAEQANLRWHRSSFMHKILDTLKEDGLITICTNIESYFKEAKEYMMSYWGLDLYRVKVKIGDAEKARTAFERKYLERGETCWEICCRKPVSAEKLFFTT